MKVKRRSGLVCHETVDRFDRYECMFIDGVAMVEIGNDETFNTLPRRNGRGEKTGFLHFAEGKGRIGLRE